MEWVNYEKEKPRFIQEVIVETADQRHYVASYRPDFDALQPFLIVIDVDTDDAKYAFICQIGDVKYWTAVTYRINE